MKRLRSGAESRRFESCQGHHESNEAGPRARPRAFRKRREAAAPPARPKRAAPRDRRLAARQRIERIPRLHAARAPHGHSPRAAPSGSSPASKNTLRVMKFHTITMNVAPIFTTR